MKRWEESRTVVAFDEEALLVVGGIRQPLAIGLFDIVTAPHRGVEQAVPALAVVLQEEGCAGLPLLVVGMMADFQQPAHVLPFTQKLFCITAFQLDCAAETAVAARYVKRTFVHRNLAQQFRLDKHRSLPIALEVFGCAVDGNFDVFVVAEAPDIQGLPAGARRTGAAGAGQQVKKGGNIVCLLLVDIFAGKARLTGKGRKCTLPPDFDHEQYGTIAVFTGRLSRHSNETEYSWQAQGG